MPLVDMPGNALSTAFDELFDVNVKGYILVAKAALRELVRTNGRIVFTVSNAGFDPGGGGVLYSASKWAVRGLITQLAYKTGATSRVNGVAPGPLASDLHSPRVRSGQHDKCRQCGTRRAD